MRRQQQVAPFVPVLVGYACSDTRLQPIHGRVFECASGRIVFRKAPGLLFGRPSDILGQHLDLYGETPAEFFPHDDCFAWSGGRDLAVSVAREYQRVFSAHGLSAGVSCIEVNGSITHVCGDIHSIVATTHRYSRRDNKWAYHHEASINRILVSDHFQHPEDHTFELSAHAVKHVAHRMSAVLGHFPHGEEVPIECVGLSARRQREVIGYLAPMIRQALSVS